MCSSEDKMIPMSDQTPVHPRPQSLADLFFSFTLLALQGFGGVLAIVQRELIEKKNLSSVVYILNMFKRIQFVKLPSENQHLKGINQNLKKEIGKLSRKMKNFK